MTATKRALKCHVKLPHIPTEAYSNTLTLLYASRVNEHKIDIILMKFSITEN